MRLRRKTILTVAAILTIMTLVIVIIASNLMMESALSQERREVSKDMGRVISAIASEGNQLGTAAIDWAGWDDTYDFIQDHNQSYIDSNLQYNTCSSLKLNYMLFFNNSFGLVYGLGYDYDTKQPMDIPNGVIDSIVQNLQWAQLSEPTGAHNGLVLTENGVLILAVHSITDSTLSAPVKGSLVMARYLSPVRMMELSSEVQVNATLFSSNDPTNSGMTSATWNDIIVSGTNWMKPVDDNTFEAFQAINGINGSAAAVAQIQNPRESVSQASSAIDLLTAMLVLISLAFCVVTLVVTDRFTMRRVESLSQQVGDIGLKGDMSYRISMGGSDELTDLANEVNKALDAIVTIDSELRDSERRYRAIVNDQTEMIVRVLEDGTITFANEAWAKEVHLETKNIIGRKLNDVLPPSLHAGLSEQCQKASATGEVVVHDYCHFHPFENREKWYSWSVRGIASDGKAREFQGVGRDLTDQKAAETALKEANKKLNLMASVTRHDVMNQLTVAHGFVSITKLQTNDPKIIEHLTKAEAALRSIQGHLEFTRDYQRTGLAEPVWISLRTTLDKAASGPRASGIVVGTDVEDYEILTDPLVEKVFYNLLDNAQRHGGGVKGIKVSCHPRDDNLLLVFQDDGRGVPTEEKEQIFQAGYGNNTGYGLFLAREILGATGMTIRETGLPGEGARFEILILPGKFRRTSSVT
jgi:PAS domain S-box-containing protein